MRVNTAVPIALAVALSAALLLGAFPVATAEESYALELTPSTFHKVVKDPSKDVFVMFYATWCGHCNRLKPKWESLALELKDSSDLIIAKIDAAVHRKISREYNVHGYPTLLLFPKNNKEGVQFKGPRDVTAFKSFLKTYTA